MPSLIRFVVVLGVLAGLVYGGMAALAFLVEPRMRPMSVPVPADRLDPQRIIVPAPGPAGAAAQQGAPNDP